MVGVYSLRSKLANNNVKEVESLDLCKNTRACLDPHYNAFDMTIITSIFGWVLVLLKCIQIINSYKFKI